MRTISTAMKTWLAGNHLAVAICVLLVRTDGVSFGFTTFDRNLTINGVTYEASNAIMASASKQATGTTVDNLSINGILRSDRITEADVLAGLYDGAALTLFLVNYRDLTMGQMILQSGQIGEIRVSDGAFSTELRSLRQHLQQQFIELTGVNCRAVLGDARCKVNLNGQTATGQDITRTGTVVSVQGADTLLLSGIVDQAGFYSDGRIRFNTGANAGLQKEIKTHGIVSSNEFEVSATNTPFDAGFRTDHTITTTSAFAIPAGTWTDAFLEVDVTWEQRGAGNTIPDTLYVSVPSGYANEQLVGSQSINGTQIATISLSSAVSAINAAAGGTLTAGLRLTNASALQHMYAHITGLTLHLTGTESGISNVIVLQETFPYPIATGDTATLIAGCDNIFSTCCTKYNNSLNYRGEPTVPGLDHILQVGRGH